MEDWEQRSLATFRTVAREVRESSIVANGQTIKHWIIPVGDDVKVGIDLLPAESFRSLCVSVRKVYQEKEPAFFYRVHNIVARYGDDQVRKQAVKVRDAYQLVLRGEGMECRIGDKIVPHEEFFETWLNGYTFHQDDRTAGPYEGFRELGLGLAVDAIVQKVALQLAGCILELDDVIADWRGEERLPRIPASGAKPG
ncbi:MAG TPA: hypothetical protein VEL79_03845 [Vicinamibacterales bacterium]|nr:hypothetical protein [Vicinamibacterales bacterium]